MYPGGGSGGGFNIPPGPPGGYPNTQGFGVPPGNVINFVCFCTLSHICFVLFSNVSARVSQVDSYSKVFFHRSLHKGTIITSHFFAF